MPSDIAALAATILLAAVQLSISSVATLRQAGPAWVAGPRDETKDITGIPGRLARAHRNLLESFPFFVAALFAVHAADAVSSLTVWGAWLFFGGRLIYVPAYVSGIPGLRSVFWQAAFIGVMVILLDLVV